MQYNGGKTRIAKYIAPIVNAERAGRFCWEPFCGGLGMTEHLKPDLASDVHPGLIALYNKLRAEPNWLDGFDCSEDDYRFARTLPDDSPIKAFIGFGCSFGGKWFAGFARPNATHPRGFADPARALLLRKLSAFPGRISLGSFFDVPPQAGFLIYADPPYAGTVKYAAVGSFDPQRFYAACEAWARAGSVVYVSEYSFPFGSLVWSRASTTTLGAGVQGGKRHEERLYRL